MPRTEKTKACKFFCTEGMFLMRCMTGVVTFFGQTKWKYVLAFSPTIPGCVVGALSVDETNCHLVFLLCIFKILSCLTSVLESRHR